MEGGGERKRKAGIELDFDELLGRDDEPPPELLIRDAPEKSMPPPPPDAEEVDTQADNHIRNLSEKDLIEKITRCKNFLNASKLVDGGEKFRASIKRMEAELARRNLEKVGVFNEKLRSICSALGIFRDCL